MRNLGIFGFGAKFLLRINNYPSCMHLDIWAGLRSSGWWGELLGAQSSQHLLAAGLHLCRKQLGWNSEDRCKRRRIWESDFEWNWIQLGTIDFLYYIINSSWN